MLIELLIEFFDEQMTTIQLIKTSPLYHSVALVNRCINLDAPIDWVLCSKCRQHRHCALRGDSLHVFPTLFLSCCRSSQLSTRRAHAHSLLTISITLQKTTLTLYLVVLATPSLTILPDILRLDGTIPLTSAFTQQAHD